MIEQSGSDVPRGVREAAAFVAADQRAGAVLLAVGDAALVGEPALAALLASVACRVGARVVWCVVWLERGSLALGVCRFRARGLRRYRPRREGRHPIARTVGLDALGSTVPIFTRGAVVFGVRPVQAVDLGTGRDHGRDLVELIVAGAGAGGGAGRIFV